MLPITSSQNPKFKAALKLQSSRGRKEQERFLIHGQRETSRACQSRVTLAELLICSAAMTSEQLQEAQALAESARVTLLDLTPDLFAKLAYGERVEPFLAVAYQPRLELAALELAAEPLVLVVEAIEKPGNLGALYRSADGAGVDAIILASPQTTPFHPNAIRASMGTVFSVPTASADSADVVRWLRERQIATFQASPDAAQSYTAIDFRRATAVVFGSEAFGLSAAWQGFPGVSLPMRGIADSLNISVSAAVIAYEARRQRDA
ncbi:MAG: RNA methyltransferase [Planctomycetota bacterium]